MLTSILLGLTGCLGYLLSTHLWHFLLSEVSLALSISVWPVAFTSYAMHYLRTDSRDGLMEAFFHKGDSIANAGVLVTGMLGGLLYKFDRHLPYWMFVIMYTVLLLAAITHLRDDRTTSNRPAQNGTHLPSVLRQTYPYVLIAVLAQFIMQPLLHYWQPLFHERFHSEAADMSVIFVSYSLAMSGISYLYSRATQHAAVRSDFFLVLLLFTSSVLYLALSYTESYIASLTVFSLLFGVVNLTRVSGSVFVQQHIPNDDRMLVTKWISLVARLGMSTRSPPLTSPEPRL